MGINGIVLFVKCMYISSVRLMKSIYFDCSATSKTTYKYKLRLFLNDLPLDDKQKAAAFNQSSNNSGNLILRQATYSGGRRKTSSMYDSRSGIPIRQISDVRRARKMDDRSVENLCDFRRSFGFL